jgi:hypothetical protein
LQEFRKVKGKYKLPIYEPIIKSNVPSLDSKGIDEINDADIMWFEPPEGWKNHIELQSRATKGCGH